MAEATRNSLRPPGDGETHVVGVFARIECAPKGLVFHVRADGRVLRLHAGSFNNLHIMAYTREAGGQITCGERKPESHAVVTFRRAPDAKAKSDGSLAALEFVPADFRLNP